MIEEEKRVDEEEDRTNIRMKNDKTKKRKIKRDASGTRLQ